MTTLTVTTQAGGCLPGTLKCDACQADELTIWHPWFGAACALCGTCYLPDEAPIDHPGIYAMHRGPPCHAVRDGLGETHWRDRRRKALAGGWRKEKA